MPLIGPFATKDAALAACGSSSSSSSSSKSSSRSASASTGGGGGGPGPCQNCPRATGGDCCPSTWTFTLSGIGGSYNPPCSDCTLTCGQFNGTVTLSWIATTVDSCIYRFYYGTKCNCNGSDLLTFWQMDYDSDDGWRLKPIGLENSGIPQRAPVYIADNPNLLDCTGCNTFYLDNTPSQCSGWPESITVCPSGMGMAGMAADALDTTAETPPEPEKKPCNCGQKRPLEQKTRPTR